MKPFIFVYTNVICAQYNDQDSLHEKAKKLQHLFRDYSPIVSNFVLLEVYTILSQRVSKETSIKFGKDIQKHASYAIIWIDKEFEQEVWNIFCQIKDKNFSYVDASILAVMKRENIKHLLSFDESFEKLQKRFDFTLIRSQ